MSEPMNITILDNEPAWLNYARREFPGASNDPAAPGLLIVSDHLIATVPAGRRFVVVTGQETTAGAVAAYRAGALDYFVKDFTPGALRGRVGEIEG